MTNSISATWGKRFLVLMLLIAGTVFARAQNSKLSLDLQRMDSGKATDVIVQYYNDATADDVAAANAAGGKNGRALNSRAARFTMNPGQAKKLIAHSNVKYISPDRNLSGMKNYTAHIYATNTDDGWNSGYNGSGIGVAVIDSGVSSVADLSGRVVYSQSFDPSNTTTSDLYGHGTHVAGIIAGNASSSSCTNCTTAVSGVAPAANIINLRVLDVNGSATDSTIISAIQTAINLKSQYNIRVLNLSLGRGIFESYTLDPLCRLHAGRWHEFRRVTGQS